MKLAIFQLDTSYHSFQQLKYNSDNDLKQNEETCKMTNDHIYEEFCSCEMYYFFMNL